MDNDEKRYYRVANSVFDRSIPKICDRLMFACLSIEEAQKAIDALNAQLPDQGELIEKLIESADELQCHCQPGVMPCTVCDAITDIRQGLSTLQQQTVDPEIESIIEENRSELYDTSHPNTGADSKLIEKMQFVIGNPGFKNMPVKELLSQAISALQQREGVVISRETAIVSLGLYDEDSHEYRELKAAIGESSG